MRTEIKKQTILNPALEKFRETTGLPVFEKIRKPPGEPQETIIQIGKHVYRAEIIPRMTMTHIAAIKHTLLNRRMKGLLITRHITPPMAAYMKEIKLAFLDTAGNAFIDEPPIYIYITGNKPHMDFIPEPVNRAFQPTGLKLLFALLCNPGMENRPYRDIANFAAVALGTVNWVLKDLERLGYLLNMGKQGRRLINRKEILLRWVTAYPERLRSKQMLGRYTTDEKDWWRNVIIPKAKRHKTLLGGEVAAARITHYLKPKTITLYTTENLAEFTVQHRLRKNPRGEIELLKPFWLLGNYPQAGPLVPPVLIYADLLATGDPRNHETAKIIYKQNITGLIEKN